MYQPIHTYAEMIEQAEQSGQPVLGIFKEASSRQSAHEVAVEIITANEQAAQVERN